MTRSPCDRCGGGEWYKDGRCAPCTRAANQRWKEANQQRHRAGSRRWAREHPEQVRTYARDSARRKRAANPEAATAAYQGWKRRNPGRNVAYEQARRARKRANGGTYTVDEWLALCAYFGHTCLRCQRTDRPLTVDHVVPLSAGGSNDISNLQPLCASCNAAKATASTDYRISWMTNRDDVAGAFPPYMARWLGEQIPG